MSEPVVTCPHCKAQIPLTKTLAEPLIDAERARFKQEAAKQSAQFELKLAEERATALKKARAQVERDSQLQMESLQTELEEKRLKIEAAQKAELEARRKIRELDEQKASLELQKQRELDAERSKIRETAAREEAERHRMRDAEHDKLVADLKAQLVEMQRKAEQGSQQLQGEVQELDLEAALRAAFPLDVLEPVPKGQHGGDCVHKVGAQSAMLSGVILWESKRTKAWSDLWLPKLRDDARAAKADLCVLVSTALPKGIERFGLVDGVWITDPVCAVPLAWALRQQLNELARARLAQVGQQDKMELAYEYLCGPQFRQRVQGIAEAFLSMREDLDAERRAFEKHWAKREKQLERLLKNTAGLYGEIQGIADKSLPEIEALALPARSIESA